MTAERELNFGAFDRAPGICVFNFVGVGHLLRSSIIDNQDRMAVVAPIEKQRYRTISAPPVHKGQVYERQPATARNFHSKLTLGTAIIVRALEVAVCLSVGITNGLSNEQVRACVVSRRIAG